MVMMIRTCFLLVLILTADNATGQQNTDARNGFSDHLKTLKNFFHIPGLAALVMNGDSVLFEEYMGLADVERGIPIDSNTTVPMASVTKTFAAILLLQLEAEQRLSLDDRITKYSKGARVADNVRIKHVLSHTSQGVPGTQFYYSGRYRLLTNVIEQGSGKSYSALMNEKILTPLGMSNTYLLEDSAQLKRENRKLAMPYVYDGSIKKGFIDFGYSTSAGIVSNVRDMAKLSRALDKNLLITNPQKQKMFTPLDSGLAYGYGIFSQQFLGHRLVWSYGQYDCYSSLFLKIPDLNLTLILTANNNLMSDPARLIYGDVTYSLFALSFIQTFVLKSTAAALLEDEQSLMELQKNSTNTGSDFFRKKLLAQALAESFMARYDSSHERLTRTLLRTVFKLYPDYSNYGDLSLLHNLFFLRQLSVSNKASNYEEFNEVFEAIARKLVGKDPNNPYVNFYLGTYFSDKDDRTKASEHFRRIVNAKNFARNWYTIEAEKWLKAHE
jgi:CubicO group peptidase (beta-lactamase class C family)